MHIIEKRMWNLSMKNKKFVTRITWKYKLLSKLTVSNYQNNRSAYPHDSDYFKFPLKQKIILECFIWFWGEWIWCIFVKCTHIIHICARGIILKWLQQQQEIGICRTCGVPAGGYRACIQMKSMFVYFSFQRRGGHHAQATQTGKAS